jgi:hypothetical protein
VRPFDLDDPSEIGRLNPFLHEKMNGKDMYPMWFILAVRLFTTTFLHAVSDYSSTYGVVDMLELLDALKESK